MKCPICNNDIIEDDYDDHVDEHYERVYKALQQEKADLP